MLEIHKKLQTEFMLIEWAMVLRLLVMVGNTVEEELFN
jgi:hypothetical protein